MKARFLPRLLALVVVAGCALYSDVSISPLIYDPAKIERGSDLQSMVRKLDYNTAISLAQTIDSKPKKTAQELAALGAAELAAGRYDAARRHLRAAIDLKRRVIEGLRPSLLDDLGLFAALRSHLTRLRENSNIDWAAHYPDIEPELEPHASLALYRIAEEALAMTLKRGSVTSTALHVEVTDGTLRMSVSDDGTPMCESDGHEVGASTALASMRHRLRVLGGKVDMRRNEAGGSVLTASMPLGARSGR